MKKSTWNITYDATFRTHTEDGSRRYYESDTDRIWSTYACIWRWQNIWKYHCPISKKMRKYNRTQWIRIWAHRRRYGNSWYTLTDCHCGHNRMNEFCSIRNNQKYHMGISNIWCSICASHCSTNRYQNRCKHKIWKITWSTSCEFCNFTNFWLSGIPWKKYPNNGNWIL